LEMSRKLDTTHVRVLKGDHRKLLFIRERVGFRNIAWVVHSLLEERTPHLATVEAVMEGNVPIILTGLPLSGKSFFVKNKLLPSLKDNPVLVIDSWDEYKDLRNIGYELYSLNFKDFNEHIRFVPNTQSRVATTEVGNIFSHLDMRRSEISKWTLIVEEAHSYKNLSTFTKFLYGSRHLVRKMIAVTPSNTFEGLVTLTVLNPQNVLC